MCLSCNRALEQPGIPPLELCDEMIALKQVSILFSKSPCEVTCADDDNDYNNVSSLGCGVLALKVLSSSRTSRILQRPAVPRRCLFGAPAAADTQRLLREDLDAAKARMRLRWGWDVSKDTPSSISNWQWEPVKSRTHPYYQVPKRAETPKLSPTSVSPIISPLPATPRITKDISPASTSSSSGTSTLAASLSSPESLTSSPILKTPSSWSLESDDSCCGKSDSEHSTTCSSSPCGSPPVVQKQLTDFWRSRRCSISEVSAKGSPIVSAPRTSTRTCSV